VQHSRGDGLREATWQRDFLGWPGLVHASFLRFVERVASLSQGGARGLMRFDLSDIEEDLKALRGSGEDVEH